MYWVTQELNIQGGPELLGQLSLAISRLYVKFMGDPIHVFCGIFNEEFDGDISFFCSIQKPGQKVSFLDILLKHVNFTNLNL